MKYMKRVTVLAIGMGLLLMAGCANQGTTDETGAVHPISTEQTTEENTNPFIIITSSEAEQTKQSEASPLDPDRFANAEHQVPDASVNPYVDPSVEPSVEPSAESSSAIPSGIDQNPVTYGQHVICIDPGHGGASGPGAQRNGVREQDLTLSVAYYLKGYLENNYDCFTVYMTRTDDTCFSSNQHDDLVARANFAYDKGAEILVSLHFNVTGTDDHSQKGCLALCSSMPWVEEKSLNLANSILNNLTQLGLNNQGITQRLSDTYFDETTGMALDYYAINRNAASLSIPGIIVEHCFIDNPEEIPFVNSPEALERLGAADARGIAQFYGL